MTMSQARAAAFELQQDLIDLDIEVEMSTVNTSELYAIRLMIKLDNYNVPIFIKVSGGFYSQGLGWGDTFNGYLTYDVSGLALKIKKALWRVEYYCNLMKPRKIKGKIKGD